MATFKDAAKLVASVFQKWMTVDTNGTGTWQVSIFQDAQIYCQRSKIMDYCTDSLVLITWNWITTALTVYGVTLAIAGILALSLLIVLILTHLDLPED
jgi:hypothetical protein